jgi:hypothetical protein
MSGTNRAVLIALPLVALVAAFWLLALGPKREKASTLEEEAASLSAQVDQQQQMAAAAEEARQDFPRAYRRVVVLGKATPADDDTASLLLQLDQIASDTGVAFTALEAQEGEGEAAPAPSTGAPQTPAGAADSSAQRVDNAEAAPPPAPATEASAASLPIGATVGEAGLPLMKYDLGFRGKFFKIADFLASVDKLIATRNEGGVGVRGRLVTIDGFELKPPDIPSADPVLKAKFQITTYVTPADEGPTGGADPAGPAPVTEAQPVAAEPSAPDSEIASTATP